MKCANKGNYHTITFFYSSTSAWKSISFVFLKRSHTLGVPKILWTKNLWHILMESLISWTEESFHSMKSSEGLRPNLTDTWRWSNINLQYTSKQYGVNLKVVGVFANHGIKDVYLFTGHWAHQEVGYIKICSTIGCHLKWVSCFPLEPFPSFFLLANGMHEIYFKWHPVLSQVSV